MKVGIIPLYGIGDVLMTTPALRVLKEVYPDWEITYLAMFRSTYQALLYNPDVDKLLYFPFLKQSKIDALRFIFSLRGKFDITINFFPSNRAQYNILAFLIGAPKRVGHRYLHCDIKELNFLKNVTIKENPELHAVEENLKLLPLLGVPENKIQRYPLQYFVSEDEIHFRESFLRDRGLSDKFLIGFHPGSSVFKNHIKKRWPADKFVELARRILRDIENSHILLFGGPEDEEVKAYIAREVGKGATVVKSETLREAAAIMARCNVFITNDSGLMHLATALQIPVVAIFGPTNPKWVGPWGKKSKVVRLNMPCSPCFYYSPKPLSCPAGKDFACLRDLPVDMVYSAMMELLHV